MKEKRILIAEDDVSTNKMLSGFLTSRGFTVEAVNDGSEALKKYKENPAQVIITDIDMPVMDGNELISHLKTVEIPPIIFVTTSHTDHEMIIDIMKKGVYDYLVKPIAMGDLLLKLNRAFEAYELKRAFEISQREKVIRLENSLEWYKFEEKIKSRDLKQMGENIFESLLTSFNQGSGFGGLVTLMSVMKSTAVQDGDCYKIKNELFKMIMDNLVSAEKALQTFGDMNKIMSGLHEPDKVSFIQLHNKISDKIKELNSKIAIKRHNLFLCDRKDFFEDLYIEVNLNYFMQALEEIILNALKFSPADSDILILFLNRYETCTITVINDIYSSGKGHKGIPIGYENLVFEPFFRLTKTVHDEYKTLDYGLGLSLVQRIINSYGGTITISNINDYSDIKAGPKIKVDCSITFNVMRDKLAIGPAL
jgi:CheY-like chemotaxis protein